MNRQGLTGFDQWILLSEKSKVTCERTWSEFSKFISLTDPTYQKPSVEDYLTYFDFLKNAKNQKASTLWSVFGQLNHVHYRFYNEKLNTYSRISDTLKVSV